MTSETELGHPSFFPAGDGNNHTARVTSQKSLSRTRWCSQPFDLLPVLLTWCPLFSAIFWLLPLLHLVAPASQVMLKLPLDPAFHWGRGFVSLLPFLRWALGGTATLCPLPPISSPTRVCIAVFPSLPFAESSSQGHRSPPYWQTKAQFLCLLTGPFCCGSHSPC